MLYPFCVIEAFVVVSVNVTLNVTVAGVDPGVPLIVSMPPLGAVLRLSDKLVTSQE
jgi:hypothetical protein